jgi:hypothetical protein
MTPSRKKNNILVHHSWRSQSDSREIIVYTIHLKRISQSATTASDLEVIMTMFERMLQLSTEGLACAQIMMQLVLDAEEKQDFDLIRSLGALNNGLRDGGLTCGALTGGACVISYYAGQGEAAEPADPDYVAMIQELQAWFSAEMGGRFGGITCPALLDNGARSKMEVCPELVEATFNKALEILDEHDLLD